jgi:hypothetical protein
VAACRPGAWGDDEYETALGTSQSTDNRSASIVPMVGARCVGTLPVDRPLAETPGNFIVFDNLSRRPQGTITRQKAEPCLESVEGTVRTLHVVFGALRAASVTAMARANRVSSVP